MIVNGDINPLTSWFLNPYTKKGHRFGAGIGPQAKSILLPTAPLLQSLVDWFLAALGFPCSLRSFPSCSVQASPCGGLCRCPARALRRVSISSWGLGLSSTGSVVVAHKLGWSAARGLFQTRHWARVLCTGRQILHRWAHPGSPPVACVLLTKLNLILSFTQYLRLLLHYSHNVAVTATTWLAKSKVFITYLFTEEFSNSWFQRCTASWRTVL